MDRLPDEVILNIILFLDISALVQLNTVSRQFCRICHDDAFWKLRCFDRSRGEAQRRRQQLQAVQDPHLIQLRDAVSALPSSGLVTWDLSQMGSSPEQAQPRPAISEPGLFRSRALANWEPGYPSENLNYYEEYIHRHGPVRIGWLKAPVSRPSERDFTREATGVAVLKDDGCSPNHVVSSLEDGTICIWDISAPRTSYAGGKGALVGQSVFGLLSEHFRTTSSINNRLAMTESGAVESISIDSIAGKGYFAVQHILHEVDLATLQLISRKEYPFTITTLSETSPATPLVIGTNMTVHLYDPRDSAFSATGGSRSGELIGGSVYSHATLAQPGPLSILHNTGSREHDTSIWVAGRFTSLLNYDRRFFPRLHRTIHSGARIASLSSIPYPYISRDMDLVRNSDVSILELSEARSAKGTTLLAAAEYKGKGSLELYGLPSMHSYQNRQTASASKLLSVAPHGGCIVFSDGDGNLKWVERDGFSHVRTVNINDPLLNGRAQPEDASAYGIWSSTGSEIPGQGDIVQKIIPVSRGEQSTNTHDNSRSDYNQSDLLLWTGDGAVGILGFGHSNPLTKDGSEDIWHDAVDSLAETAEQKAREDAERQYAGAMRRALKRNADEVRFMRGLGHGFRR